MQPGLTRLQIASSAGALFSPISARLAARLVACSSRDRARVARPSPAGAPRGLSAPVRWLAKKKGLLLVVCFSKIGMSKYQNIILEGSSLVVPMPILDLIFFFLQRLSH